MPGMQVSAFHTPMPVTLRGGAGFHLPASHCLMQGSAFHTPMPVTLRGGAGLHLPASHCLHRGATPIGQGSHLLHSTPRRCATPQSEPGPPTRQGFSLLHLWD
ncbi:hypothetical protein NDU88_000528 [Pleurodeles waltl]|uniref:Uncharacterized protein n=1 Tax=Pleurodeles waltl TaxID=8319 RepID=A0AAV7TF95_PLEWA|nr:hypothetical protein NDU88_000527 [Pleurodeles waltl]KAJ1175237.1 hypothetical protein NDU88_000528 [Pleurodeles waltl]